MDLALLVESAGDQMRLLCQHLAVEVAAIFPVVTGRLGAPMLISVGEPTAVRVTPQAVYAPALSTRADSVILVHNHVSDLGPSVENHAVTRRLVAAGAVLGVPLLAHLVVAKSGKIWHVT